MERASREFDAFTSNQSMNPVRDLPQHLVLILIVAAWLAAILAVLILR